ncbi:MAG TPA: glycosyltransferase [Candidatus Sulfotelmatobacter sp.]|jgi:hypothetical protein|nr:glycosyltransferase [Candidatus Sulfotelmatobacter sp.]
MSTIPKIVHRVWFGTNPIPETYETWWQAWQRQWPDHAFVTWTDADIPKLPLVADQIALARNFAEKSDIARYEIVRQFGGIYLDCDIMPLYPVDFTALGADLVRNPCRLESFNDLDGNEHHAMGCGNEFFAACPNHPVLEEAIARIRRIELPQNSDLIDTVQKTGPFFWGEVVEGQGLELPAGAISPYFYEEPFSVLYERNLDHVYGIHVWGNSWIPPTYQRYKLDKLLWYGDIRAIEALLPKTDISQDEYDRRMLKITAIRDARYHITQSVMHLSLGHAVLQPVNRELYHPFKFFLYLATEQRKYGDSVGRVWHIGAAHPQVARELRPVLVNFDPEALLIDEVPETFARLQASYAGNINARFLLGRISDAASLAGSELPEVLAFSTSRQNLELLDGILASDSKPRLIILSADGSSPEDWDTLYARMPTYRVIQFDGFACAYRKDWFFYYSAYLFTDHGIPGIFAGQVETIFSTARPPP